MKKSLYYAGIFVLFGLIGLVIWQVSAITILKGQISTVSLFAEELDAVNPLISHCVTAIFGILIGHWWIPPGDSQ